MQSYALGLIETKGLIGAIEATDAAAKAAAVVIASAELTDAAFMTVKIEGELGAVQAAVEAGAQAAARIGELVAAHVIPRPSDNLGAITPDRRYVSKYHDEDARPAIHYESKGSTSSTHVGPRSDKQLREAYADSSVRQVTETKMPRSGGERKATATSHTPEISPLRSESPRNVESSSSREQVPTRAELEAMSVVALRQFARNLTNLPIQGRQISMANRHQLLDAIAKILPLK